MKILVIILLLASCAKEASETVVNGEYEVSFLFQHEGCSIYRFYDTGKYIHYTNCTGETIKTHSCGKNCSYNKNVKTTSEKI